MALLHEPANGLNPAGVVEIRQLLQGLACERSTTVFMPSRIRPGRAPRHPLLHLAGGISLACSLGYT